MEPIREWSPPEESGQYATSLRYYKRQLDYAREIYNWVADQYIALKALPPTLNEKQINERKAYEQQLTALKKRAELHEKEYLRRQKEEIDKIEEPQSREATQSAAEREQIKAETARYIAAGHFDKNGVWQWGKSETALSKEEADKAEADEKEAYIRERQDRLDELNTRVTEQGLDIERGKWALEQEMAPEKLRGLVLSNEQAAANIESTQVDTEGAKQDISQKAEIFPIQKRQAEANLEATLRAIGLTDAQIEETKASIKQTQAQTEGVEIANEQARAGDFTTSFKQLRDAVKSGDLPLDAAINQWINIETGSTPFERMTQKADMGLSAFNAAASAGILGPEAGLDPNGDLSRMFADRGMDISFQSGQGGGQTLDQFGQSMGMPAQSDPTMGMGMSNPFGAPQSAGGIPQPQNAPVDLDSMDPAARQAWMQGAVPAAPPAPAPAPAPQVSDPSGGQNAGGTTIIVQNAGSQPNNGMPPGTGAESPLQFSPTTGQNAPPGNIVGPNGPVNKQPFPQLGAGENGSRFRWAHRDYGG